MGAEMVGQHRHSPLAVCMLEPVLLALVKERPRHGYSLLTDLGALGIDSIHPSVVYRTLREMEDLNWIRSDWENEQTQGPPRRTYQLTSQGDEALANWKRELEMTRNLITQLFFRSE
jgi:PadR family transcriptional regulator, regulatory protein PadR